MQDYGLGQTNAKFASYFRTQYRISTIVLTGLSEVARNSIDHE